VRVAETSREFDSQTFWMCVNSHVLLPDVADDAYAPGLC